MGKMSKEEKVSVSPLPWRAHRTGPVGGPLGGNMGREEVTVQKVTLFLGSETFSPFHISAL